MRRLLLLIAAVCMALSGMCIQYNISFQSKPIGEALSMFASKYPDIKLSFIYNELGNYQTSASVSTDNALKAVKQIVGLNPITVTEKDGKIFVEAIQKGKYLYRGRLVNEFSDPVPSATVLLLNPRDSSVITYGITGSNGSFLIPCDMSGVDIKITSTGYKTRKLKSTGTDIGKIAMQTLAVDLDSIIVKADEMKMLADRFVYVPGKRQKNSAISGIDLLERMSIPQLSFNPRNGSPQTQTGKPVGIFIDNMPASDSDLKGMNLQDVKSVEYLEFPQDPRFLGQQFVVNFIMQKYEYGGYLRLYGYEHFIMNSGFVQPTARFQYKKMTFDLSAIGFYHDNNHYGDQTTETFRLPQQDGTVKEFNRFTESKSAKDKREQYFLTFRATYNSDKLTARNTLAATIDNKPHEDRAGSVTYTPEDFPNSQYTSVTNRNIRNLRYEGFFHLALNNSNSLTFTPQYKYTHTEQSNVYEETGLAKIINTAKDNSNSASGRLSFTHTFHNGSLRIFANEDFNHYRTLYAGSANSLDRSYSFRSSLGAAYNISAGNFYGDINAGWNIDKLKMNDEKSNTSSPFANLSLQYSFSGKHRIAASISYSTFEPSSSFKSENIIKAHPLLSYTGNPALVPMKNLGYSLSYSWIPSQRFSMSFAASMTDIRDRYVYFYESSPSGILRTIRQPLGSYRLGYIGVSFSSNFFNKNLRINGGAALQPAQSGEPYNYTRWPVTYYLRTNYYLNDFYFSGNFTSRQHYSDGIMVGHWMEYACTYSLAAGWGNGKWNIRATAANFGRWNWKDHRAWFKTAAYDYDTTEFSPIERAYFTLNLTYTFNYGKKVRSNNEPGGPDTGSSGILKQ